MLSLILISLIILILFLIIKYQHIDIFNFIIKKDSVEYLTNFILDVIFIKLYFLLPLEKLGCPNGEIIFFLDYFVNTSFSFSFSFSNIFYLNYYLPFLAPLNLFDLGDAISSCLPKGFGNLNFNLPTFSKGV